MLTFWDFSWSDFFSYLTPFLSSSQALQEEHGNMEVETSDIPYSKKFGGLNQKVSKSDLNRPDLFDGIFEAWL